MAKAKKTEEVVTIPRPNIKRLNLLIVGESRLVVHQFPEKARKQMSDKHAQKATTGRKKRVPEDEYAASMYWLDKNGELTSPKGDPAKHKYGFGFKSVGFKAAAVRAGKEALQMNMTFTRTAFHVMGEFVKIEGTPNMREDVVRVGNGAADLRYRGEFKKWKAVLPIHYNANVISAEQIFNLFVYAGFGVGVGEYRPQNDGNWGRFSVSSTVAVQ